MSEKKAKGGGHGGGGGGGGHATEKAKAFVESVLGMTEMAAYNVAPYVMVGREIWRRLFEGGASQTMGAAYFSGLVGAFIYSFGKEMLTGALSKLGGGGAH